MDLYCTPSGAPLCVSVDDVSLDHTGWAPEHPNVGVAPTTNASHSGTVTQPRGLSRLGLPVGRTPVSNADR